jgi:hypothetical protein
MIFTPKTPEQLNPLFPKGEYQYIIKECSERESKKFVPMFEVILRINDKTGKSKIITDYILFDDAFDWKLRHICYSCGLHEKYETGNIEAHEFEGKQGIAKVGIQVDKQGQYKDKNCILDYIEDTTIKTEPQKSDKDFDDTIPF